MTTVQDLLKRGRYWLGPMAGVADSAFREVCIRHGATLTYSEMVSAKGLHYSATSEHNKSRELLILAPSEKDLIVQIFGNDPDIISNQAAILAESMSDELACIDLNMCCPVPKVVRKGEGAALMRDPETAEIIVSRVASALEPFGKQVTVKIRRGWDSDTDNAVEFALRMQEAGAAAVAVHGRFRSQYYTGTSARETLAQVAEALSVPVFGTGDVFTAQDALDLRTETNVDGVLIARGALGSPWIFNEIARLEAGETNLAPATKEMRLEAMREHAHIIRELYGEHALVRMRYHAAHYCATLPGAAAFRRQLNTVTDIEGLLAAIDEFGNDECA